MAIRLEVAVNETLARWDREADAAVKIALNHGAQPLFTFKYSEDGGTYLAVQAPAGAKEQTREELKNTIVCRIPDEKLDATMIWLQQKQLSKDYDTKKACFAQAQEAIQQATLTMGYETGKQFVKQLNEHVATLNQ